MNNNNNENIKIRREIELNKQLPDSRGPYAGDAKLFIANLSFQITKNDLEKIFSEFGIVSEVNINCDKQTGRSKGFGFVTMDDARDAADAVRKLNQLNKLNIKKYFFSSNTSTTTTNITNINEKYSLSMQLSHWLMGSSILLSIGCVQGAINTKDKKFKGDLMFYHKSFGLLSFIFLLPRIGARLISKIPQHVPGNQFEIISAQIMHRLLQLFIIIMPVSGVVMGYYSGKGLPFFWQTLPGAEKANGDIAKQSFQVHKFVGHYFQYLIPVHVGAVGYHFVAKGTNILPRMLPFR